MAPTRRAPRQAAAAGVLGALCGAVLLAVGGLRGAPEGRSALLGGLLPLKPAWADSMDHEAVYRRVAAPHRQGHRIFAPLDEPVLHSITRDIPNMVDTALEPSNNYEDKLNRKLLRLQREKESLEARKHDIIHGLVSDRDKQQRRAAARAVDAHHQRLRDALKRARREQWAQYEKAATRYAQARTHSKMRADEYLKRRSRVMARIKELDQLLTYGDGQLMTEREKWHSEWLPYEHAHGPGRVSGQDEDVALPHDNAPPASSESSVPDGDLDGLLTSIEGQAAALGEDSEKEALLANVKKLHSIIAHGGSENGGANVKVPVTIPDKRRCAHGSWVHARA